ncbi:MAG: HAMP domain-containing histidine kinase [Bacteroidales bacterium]|nr:HAMP domain-containing histidine kinase [Bacteroidales bacterium]
MKSNYIRLAVILGSVSVIGILLFQFYWIRKTFGLAEQQFNRTVHIALYRVAGKMAEFNGSELPNENPVKQITSNYFIVDVNDVIDAKILDHFLKTEFEYSNIRIDYEYAIYDCETNQMVYGNYINQSRKSENRADRFQKYDEFTYYFGILFPSKTAYILQDMDIWLVSSLVLIAAMAFFAYSIFVILKQKRLSEVQKDFINNMTHEFKTPISTIGIAASVLSDPDILTEPWRLQNYAAIISDQNKKLQNHIEKVLQLATLDSPPFSLKIEKVDCHELIREVITNFRISIPQISDYVSLDLAARDRMILADRLHCTNLIFNLVDNAVKYSKENPRISVSTRNEDSHKLILMVADQGIGIEMRYQKKIFDRFFRVPSGNVHNVKGFGLGLHYVMSIVENHKWKMSMESTHGQGTCFTIIIPVADK